MKHKKRRWLIVILVMIFVLSQNHSQAESNITKNETVYVMLTETGQVQKISVVNTVYQPFDVMIDYGNYTHIMDFTDAHTYQIDQDQIVITKQKPDEPLFYQGVLRDKKIPWDIQLSYSLNGNAIDPQVLAGKSGLVEVIIQIKPVDLDYSQNFVLQVQWTLDHAKQKLVAIEGAMQTPIGKSTQIAATILSNQEGYIKIGIETDSFEMKGIEIIAIPSQNEMMGFSDVQLNEMMQLEKGSIQIKEGLIELKSGLYGLYEGIEGLHVGLLQMTDLLPGMERGLYEYGQGLSQYVNGIQRSHLAYTEVQQNHKQIHQRSLAILSGYEQIQSQLKDEDAEIKQMALALLDSEDAYAKAVAQTLLMYMEQTKAIQLNLENLNQGLDEIFSATNQINEGFLMLNQQTEQMIHSGNQLIKGYDDLQAGVLEATTALVDIEQGVGMLKQQSRSLPEGLDAFIQAQNQIIEGMQQAFEIFNMERTPLVSFVAKENTIPGSVQFIMKTPDIKEVTIENDEQEHQTSRSLWQRFLALFRKN